MRKIALYIILLGFAIMLTWYITKNYTWKTARQKYNPILSANYANIIYAFSQNKQDDLLYTSSTIIGTQIINIKNSTNIDMNYYSYLCPMLTNSFKHLVLKSFNKQKKLYRKHIQDYMDDNITINLDQKVRDFEDGYEKLIEFCNRKNNSTP